MKRSTKMTLSRCMREGNFCFIKSPAIEQSVVYYYSRRVSFEPVDTINNLFLRFEKFCKVKTNNKSLCLDRTYIGLKAVHWIEGYSSFLPRSKTKIRTIKACCIPEKIPIFDFWNGCYKQGQEDLNLAPKKCHWTCKLLLLALLRNFAGNLHSL